MRSVLLQIAAALVVLTALAHSYLGERYILIRLFRREDLPRLFGGTAFTTRTLRLAWHITSVAFLGIAVLLVLLTRPEVPLAHAVAVTLALTSAACGLVSLVVSRGAHLSWIVFFAVAALTWLAA